MYLRSSRLILNLYRFFLLFVSLFVVVVVQKKEWKEERLIQRMNEWKKERKMNEMENIWGELIKRDYV